MKKKGDKSLKIVKIADIYIAICSRIDEITTLTIYRQNCVHTVIHLSSNVISVSSNCNLLPKIWVVNYT